MEINTLQQRINERAEAKFKQTMDDVMKALDKIEVLKRLTIKVVKGEYSKPFFASKYGNRGLFTQNNNKGLGDLDILKEATNYDKLREEMIAEFAQEETDRLLEQIDSIQDIISNQE